jgi:protein SCO1/2
MKEIRKRMSEVVKKAVKATLPPPAQGRGGDYFPNNPMNSHTGETFRLYDDLIRNNVVTLNFMSIKGHDRYPVTEHLARIANLLGDRLGRDILMLSITTDPQHDTPERMKAMADKYGVKPGWHFLTASEGRVNAISDRLYKHKHAGHHGHGHPTRLVHYGNGSVGLWGAFPADSDPGFVVERLSWVEFGKPSNGQIRRAGPRRMGNNVLTHNRELT